RALEHVFGDLGRERVPQPFLRGRYVRRLRLGRGLCGRGGPLAFGLGLAVLRCPAEQGREGSLAHARALTGWHLRGPPSRAACRHVLPFRRDRISAPTCPSPAPRRTVSSYGSAKRKRG